MLKRSSLLAIGFATLAAAWWPTPGVADTFTTIAGSSDYEGHPAIAFDFGGFDSSKDFAKYLPRYMIAYEYFTTSGPGAGYTTINSRYVDIDGNLGPINLVSPAYGFYSHPTLAFKWGTYGQQNLVYLAAWQDAHGPIVYNFLDNDGLPLSSGFQIDPPAGQLYMDPAAASDPFGKWYPSPMSCNTYGCNPYLVAYRARDRDNSEEQPPQPTRIKLSKISAENGDLLGSTEVEYLGLLPNDPLYAPSLAYGHSSSAGHGDTFVLTYRRANGQIVVRTVPNDHSSTPVVRVPTVVAWESSGRPVVSYGLARDRWLVVWRTSKYVRGGGGYVMLKGQFFSTLFGDPMLIGSPFTIAGAPIPQDLSSTAADDVIPDYSVIGGDRLMDGTSEGAFAVSYSRLNGSYREIYVANVSTDHRNDWSSNVPYSVSAAENRYVVSAVGRIDPPERSTDALIPGASAKCNGAFPDTRCAMWVWDARYGSDHDVQGYLTSWLY